MKFNELYVTNLIRSVIRYIDTGLSLSLCKTDREAKGACVYTAGLHVWCNSWKEIFNDAEIAP